MKVPRGLHTSPHPNYTWGILSINNCGRPISQFPFGHWGNFLWAHWIPCPAFLLIRYHNGAVWMSQTLLFQPRWPWEKRTGCRHLPLPDSTLHLVKLQSPKLCRICTKTGTWPRGTGQRVHNSAHMDGSIDLWQRGEGLTKGKDSPTINSAGKSGHHIQRCTLDTTLHTKLTKNPTFHIKPFWVIWKQQSFCIQEASPNFQIFITFSSWHCLGHQETQLSSVSMLPCVVLKPKRQWVPRSLSSSQQRCWPRCPCWSPVVPEETQLLSAALNWVCREHARAVCQWCGLSATL